MSRTILCVIEMAVNIGQWMWIKLCCDESLLATSSQQTWQGRGLQPARPETWAASGPGSLARAAPATQWSLWSCSLSPPAHWLLVIGLCLVCRKAAKCCKYSELCNKQHRPVTREYTASPASRAAVIMHYAHYGHVDHRSDASMFYCIYTQFVLIGRTSIITFNGCKTISVKYSNLTT